MDQGSLLSTGSSGQATINHSKQHALDKNIAASNHVYIRTENVFYTIMKILVSQKYIKDRLVAIHHKISVYIMNHNQQKINIIFYLRLGEIS